MENGKIGICVIGAGRAGMIHAVNFRKRVPNAELIAVVDPIGDVAEKASRQLEISKYYKGYKDALIDDEVDAVVVVTPTVYTNV